MVLKNMEIFPFSLHGQRNGRRASNPSGLQPALSSMENSMDESFKLCRPVPIATVGNRDAGHITSVVSSPVRATTTPSTSPKSEAKHRSLGRFLLLAAALTVAMPGLMSAQQLKMPNSERCRAPDANSQTQGENQTALADPQDNDDKLSDCGGVLKPPVTGDSAMEKPAPRGGKTPVIPPSEVPGQQEQQTPEAK
ncbi:hypothetical protein ACXHXG_25850 [Rhizobium sp. LEGMi198b]|uniref:hypothetical protein n=2 Tax=Rhizobium TaxID=379 RepID=UPI000CDF3DD4|nr:MULTISPECIES: hypothetical protein [Rhizobium]AVA25091.1 hypothetical protein NXC24_PC00646 [Rhizobium sp. NXC24]UWU24876.1 hypothetical protein N2601_22315 [Rhizobium tropici]WFU04238.1 hypothetical protein QA648_25950 [Rhizobium sp. CB3171]